MGITSPERIDGKLGSTERRKECKKNRAIKIGHVPERCFTGDNNENHKNTETYEPQWREEHIRSPYKK